MILISMLQRFLSYDVRASSPTVAHRVTSYLMLKLIDIATAIPCALSPMPFEFHCLLIHLPVSELSFSIQNYLPIHQKQHLLK